MIAAINRWFTFEAPAWFKNGKIERFFDLLSKANMWVRYRIQPQHRYNVVYTDLPPGYYDIDVIMERAMVELLRRYVEDEMGGIDQLREFNESLRDSANNPEEGREFESPMLASQADRDDKIMMAYDWFFKERNLLQIELDRHLNIWRGSGLFDREILPDGLVRLKRTKLTDEQSESWKASESLESYINKTNDEMLLLILNNRHSMWT